MPLCLDEGIGVIPWSPLARGHLTRPWGTDTERSTTDAFGRSLYEQSDRTIVERVAQVAEERGVPMAQVALAWVSQVPGVVAPIVGATTSHHLDDAVASLDVTLSAEEVALLEEPYAPHAPAGFS